HDRRKLCELESRCCIAAESESLQIASDAGHVFEDRDEHLILEIASLRPGVKRDCRRSEVRDKGCNRAANADARGHIGHGNPFAPGKSVPGASHDPIDLFEWRVIIQNSSFTGSTIGCEELSADWIECHSERVSQASRNNLGLWIR